MYCNSKETQTERTSKEWLCSSTHKVWGYEWTRFQSVNIFKKTRPVSQITFDPHCVQNLSLWYLITHNKGIRNPLKIVFPNIVEVPIEGTTLGGLKRYKTYLEREMDCEARPSSRWTSDHKTLKNIKETDEVYQENQWMLTTLIEKLIPRPRWTWDHKTPNNIERNW